MRVATLACCSVALLGLLGTAAGWSAGDGWPGSLSTTFNRPLPPSMASWQMNRSTLCFFVGNETSSDSPAELRSEARFGTVGIGWQLANVQQNFSRVEAAELVKHQIDLVRATHVLGSTAPAPASRCITAF